MQQTKVTAVGALILTAALGGCRQGEPAGAGDVAQAPPAAGAPDVEVASGWIEFDFKGAADGVARSSREMAESGVRMAGDLANSTRDRVGELLQDERFRGYLNEASKSFGETLARFENDPSRALTGAELVQRLGVRRIPVLKSVDRYADARALYRHASATIEVYESGQGDPLVGSEEYDFALKQIETAKRDCLLACIAGGLDVTLLGLPSALELPVTVADAAVDVGTIGHDVRVALEGLESDGWIRIPWGQLDPKRLDLFSPMLDKALEFENVDSAMVILLTYDFDAQ